MAGFPPATKWDQITGDESLQRELSEAYGDVDNLEFFVGLFAEDVPEGGTLPPLIGRLVAVDAFSQALTNPLLSRRVFNRESFAEEWEAFHETSKLQDVVRRNVPEFGGKMPVVSMSLRS